MSELSDIQNGFCRSMYSDMRKSYGAPVMLLVRKDTFASSSYIIESKDGLLLENITEHCSWCAKATACKMWHESQPIKTEKG